MNRRKKEEDKYLFTDVASFTLTFSDGSQTRISTSSERDLILVRLFPRTLQLKEFEENVMTNYMLVNSVPELAEACGYSCLKTFTRHFKKHFRKTPYQWMLDRKMEEIRTLTLRSGMSIKKIAKIYGFKNTSNLVNAYTKAFGVPPQKDRILSVS